MVNVVAIQKSFYLNISKVLICDSILAYYVFYIQENIVKET
jgi:hypothetical protein